MTTESEQLTDYFVPNSLVDAVAYLNDNEVKILAGGTDLMLQKQFAPHLMNVRRLREIQGVEEHESAITIGALTTMTDLLGNELIASTLPSLRDMADQFASNQIRNMATIGGNICNASPAGDGLVPLIVLDAEVALASQDGIRNVMLADFLTGPGQTQIKGNEMLISVVIPKPKPDYVDGFRKVGVRPALEISLVTVGIGGELRDDALHNVRVGFGAVAPKAIRGAATEAALEGKTLNSDTIAAAIAAVDEDIAPITDVRATEWYRRHLARAMTEEILTHVSDR
jgi:xanthine dehydrogenase FAD-binding subunit